MPVEEVQGPVRESRRPGRVGRPQHSLATPVGVGRESGGPLVRPGRDRVRRPIDRVLGRLDEQRRNPGVRVPNRLRQVPGPAVHVVNGKDARRPLDAPHAVGSGPRASTPRRAAADG